MYTITLGDKLYNQCVTWVLITEHGRPSAYLLDVDDYEMMQDRIGILEGIARGETAYQEGGVYSQSTAKNKMKKWLR